MGKLGPYLTAFYSPHLSETNTGLGNVLFQIASTYGIAKALEVDFNGQHIAEFATKLRENFGFHHGDTIFRNFISHEDPHDPDIVLYEAPNHHKLFDISLISRINQMKHVMSIYVQGYLESHTYFSHCQQELRELFGIDNTSKEYLQTKYPFLFDTAKTLIAIHIRTGNSIVEIDKAYYERSIAHMRDKYPSAEVVLFTNDSNNEVVQHLLSTLPKVHRVQEREDYLELWAFAQTHHAICCFSTFSWWGAFLMKNPTKTIIVPQSSIDYMMKTYHVDEETLRNGYYFPEYSIL